MKHFSEEEINNFRLFKVDSELFGAMLNHFAECDICLQKIEEMTPEISNLFNQRLNYGKKIIDAGHFQIENIQAYVDWDIQAQARKPMAEHFRQCEDCFAKLKQSTPNYNDLIAGDIFGVLESPKSIYTIDSKDIPRKQWLSYLMPLTASILLISVVLALLFYQPNNSDEIAILENVEINQNQKTMITENIQSNISTNQGGFNKLPSKANHNVSYNQTDQSKPIVLRKDDFRKNISVTKERLHGEKIISKTRGNRINDECLDDNLKPSALNENGIVTINWQKIPEAIKYHLFIVNESQNVIDEFESAENRTYKSEKLEQGLLYELKVVATLSNGKTIYSKTLPFRINEKNRLIKVKREKGLTRCVN